MSLQDIYHFLPLSDRLFTAGMPTAEQLADAARAGVQVVINLATPNSERALPNESSVVESLGMTYIGVPVQWDHPTRHDLDIFMDAMDAHSGHTVLIHCQANYRVTGFMALYRVLRLGWKLDEAAAAARVVEQELEEGARPGRPRCRHLGLASIVDRLR